MIKDTREMKRNWADALSIIEGQMSELTYTTWIMPLIPYQMTEDTLTLQAPEQMGRDVVEARYSEIVENALQRVTHRKMQIKLLLPEEIEGVSHVETDLKKQGNLLSSLNPKYVFDTFVVGNSNRFAHAASLAVAENPFKAYNPLFLYGDAGLGKTHLMHSIAHYIVDKNRNLKVLYASSETFTNELINSIREDKNQAFRDKYRNIDVLLIDDIQFISQKERTQEEFFHTFNALHSANKQIIISSDRPPKEIKTLEERLRSRFEWGLIADIQKPDYETRIAILQKKAEKEGFVVPPEIIEMIAKSIHSNIRELEGALNKLMAFANLIPGSPITIEMTQDAIKDLCKKNARPAVTVEYIQEVVANYYGVSIDDIISKKRNKNISDPRQIAMYLCRKLLSDPLLKIGEKFGGRDHTTVMHGCDKVSSLIESDGSMSQVILDLEKRIKGE